jgi:predicted porin
MEHVLFNNFQGFDMKKTWIAVAAFAAVGAASAQVTIYGKLDVGVSNTSAGGSTIGINGWETSRFGLKAEQKEGGLTFSANLEGKIQDGSGKFGGFDRAATVGVSGSYGAVTLGSQWTPFDNAVWTSDALEYNGFTPLKGLKAAWNYDLGNAPNMYGNAVNSFQYATPVMNGFQGIVLTAPNASGTFSGAKDYTGFGLNYANGPLTINFATQAFSGAGTPTANSNVLSLQYNMGVATVMGGLVNSDKGSNTAWGADGNAGTDKGYILGVKYPMGANSVSVGFSGNTNSVAGKETTISSWGAQYIMALSKPAVAYFGYQSIDSVGKTGAGIRYNF